MKTIKFPQVKDAVTALNGGLDQLTPTLECPPGILRECINWEVSTLGGLRYPHGYERYSGKAKPSEATYQFLAIQSFTNVPAVGEIVTGLASGSTAQVLLVVNTTSEKYLIGYFLTGPGFQGNEGLVNASTQTIGTFVPPTGLPTTKQHYQYLVLAAAVRRALITAPPNGIGPMRGIVGGIFNGRSEVFAFRDKRLGGTANPLVCAIYRASSSGWVDVTARMGGEVQFRLGSGAPPPEGSGTVYFGQTLIVKRVLTQSGSWGAGTAAGFIVYQVAPGGFYDGLLHPAFSPYTIGPATFTTVHTGGNVLLNPSGRFEFDYGNFGGQLSTARLYGCDGVNRGFELFVDTDGPTLVPIGTGTETPSYDSLVGRYVTFRDNPAYVRIHHKHLFLAIGSSVMNSALATVGGPYNWEAANGAAENAAGDKVTGLVIMPGNNDNAALAVLLRNHTKILYGTSSANWKLVSLESDTGAVPHAAVKMDQLYMFDDRGVSGFAQSQAFGNFEGGALTERIQAFIDAKRGRLTCSVLNRAKGQMRFYFNDGTALYLTFDKGKLRGMSTMYFPIVFTCAWSGEDVGGAEVVYAGGSDGMVYQLDQGTSFDGDAIFTRLKNTWDPCKAPRLDKHFINASFAIADENFAEFTVEHELGYGNDQIGQGTAQTFQMMPTELPQWNHFDWDAWTWDGANKEETRVDLGGDGPNIRYTLTSNVNYLPPFRLTHVLTSYVIRGRQR